MAKKKQIRKPRRVALSAIELPGRAIQKHQGTSTWLPDTIRKAVAAVRNGRVQFGDQIEALLVWETDAEDLNSRELADFLLSFTRMYSAGSQLEDRPDAYTSERGLPRPRPMDGISIKRISYASPLEMVICGVAVGIAIAVVFSGGQFEISTKGIKAKLPPIGTGIAAIARALASMPKRRSLYDEIPFDDPSPPEAIARKLPSKASKLGKGTAKTLRSQTVNKKPLASRKNKI